MKKIVCYVIIAILLVTSGCGKKELQAAEYVKADLNLVFQGETEDAKKFIDATSAELEQIYENGIDAFVESYLTGGIDTEGTYTEVFSYPVKEIFRSMQYQVGEAEKIDGDSYEVPVTYRPVNVFQIFTEGLETVSMELERKREAGDYEGTEEEQDQAMLIDYLEKSYSLLMDAYLQMEYAEQEIYTFQVTRSENDTPEMQEEEINEFIERILALDKL